MDQVYIPKRDYRVLVKCLTYNQSKYIKDALNGFVIQQTNFPFICLIMDDCSTDGEQEVIKSWMARECDMGKAENLEIEKSHITIVPHKSNPNCHIAFYFLKQNLYKTGGKAPLISPWRKSCEYEALCEGDDYWTDPQKLQKQVDFLDANPEYSMCFHGADICNEIFGIDTSFIECQFVESREYHENDVFPAWVVPTASIVFNIREVFSCKLVKESWACRGDLPLILRCMKTGRVYGFAEHMSCYRVQTGGVTYDKVQSTKIHSRLPEYWRFLKKNFPAINKFVICHYIRDSYYHRGSTSKGWKRIKDYYFYSLYRFLFLAMRIVRKLRYLFH